MIFETIELEAISFELSRAFLEADEKIRPVLEQIRDTVDRLEAYLLRPTTRDGMRARKAIAYAAVLFDVGVRDILSDRRDKNIVRARHAVAFTLKQTTGYSLPQIGGYLGGRDHTTIISALKTAEKWREREPEYRLLTDRMVQTFTQKDQEAQPCLV